MQTPSKKLANQVTLLQNTPATSDRRQSYLCKRNRAAPVRSNCKPHNISITSVHVYKRAADTVGGEHKHVQAPPAVLLLLRKIAASTHATSAIGLLF